MIKAPKLDYFKEFLDFFQLSQTAFVEISLKRISIKFVKSIQLDSSINIVDDFVEYPIADFHTFLYGDSVTKIHEKMDQYLALKYGERHDDEFQIIGTDEKIHWLRLTVIRVDEDCFKGMLQDVTSRKERDNQLKHQDIQNEMILNNISEFVVLYDEKGDLIYGNSSFYNHFFPGEENIFNINNATNKEEQWFANCFKEPYHFDNIAYYKNLRSNENVYIKWYNRALFVDGEITSVISVGMDVSEIQKSNERLEYELYHDSATGFLNQRGLIKRLEELKETSFDLYYLQMSRYISLQDFYGNDIVSHLMMQYHNVLHGLRNAGLIIGVMDDGKYVLINTLQSYSRANLQRNLFHEMNRLFSSDNYSIYVTTDIGMVNYPEDTDDLTAVIQYGNITVHVARQQRMDRILRYRDEFFESTREEIEMIKDLRKTMDNNEISLVFQDIIDLNTEKVAYVETLARWYHPDKGSISPLHFFELAQRSYLGVELDFQIIKKALVKFKSFCTLKRYEQAILTINVSPKTFLHPNFADGMYDVAASIGVNPQRICIEISENTFASEDKNYQHQTDAIKAYAFKVALDDFGRHYSSLALINQINFDIIKIDKAFVDTLDKPATQSILEMLYQLSKHLKCEIIVEGVETKEQVEKLQAIGYNYIQGYYFSKPKPWSSFSNS